MVTVTTVKCPTCKEIIYSRANHDFKYCSCGEIFVDGGLDHIRIGGKDLVAIVTSTIEIDATEKELYDDWNYNKNKYGRVIEQKE